MNETEVKVETSIVNLISNTSSSSSVNDLLTQSQSDSACSISSINNKSAATNKAPNTEKRKRLSLIGNVQLPSVHGCLSSSNKNAANSNKTIRTRLSTHQRNLSLDFRSMGILLPPVSQVTSSHINSTQHHRNRSLDSALQGIPEVEATSPGMETDNTLCPNFILASKIPTSLTHQSNAPTTNIYDESVLSSSATNCSSDSPTINTAAVTPAYENVKKREDLTNLGSDDSGILCGYETDQASLNLNCRSRESLDSADVEECIEILENISMNEDYTMMQSDLTLGQPSPVEKVQPSITQMMESRTPSTEKPIEPIRSADIRSPTEKVRRSKLFTTCVPINFEDTDVSKVSACDKKSPQQEQYNEAGTASSKGSKADHAMSVEHVKMGHNKNDVNFKNIFGATKNLFRTAQSIIESHDKKNVQKNRMENDDEQQQQQQQQQNHQQTQSQQQTKSSHEISKKKEFFTSKSSITKSTTPTQESTHENEVSLSGSSIMAPAKGEDKAKVPGIVKCFIKSNRDNDQSSFRSQVNKRHNGLLRFFESPIFNIHFAIHYLFYSKEPGVLTFIGNKIFSFKDQDVDLYIPQLILMYIQMDELAEVLDPYLVYRCQKAVDFSLKCAWLLEAFSYNMDIFKQNSGKRTHLLLMKELYPKHERRQVFNLDGAVKPNLASPIKKTHFRSQSDATGMLNATGSLTLPAKFQPSIRLCLGDLSTGRAFDNGCSCFESVRGTVNDLRGQRTVCTCGAPKLAPQREFIKSLIDVAAILAPLPTKAEKTSVLRMRLNLINKNLPARVWLPLNSDMPHHVVRIKEEKTAILNSKDKTPYIIYVEVVEVNDIYTSPVIPKMMPSLRHTKSEEYLDQNISQSDESNKVLALQSDLDSRRNWHEYGITDDDVWLQDELSAQFTRTPAVFNVGDVRIRHLKNLNSENTKQTFGDPEDPSAAILKESWNEKENKIRDSSPYGHLSNWRLLSAIVKCGDDLRQELMATQLLEVFRLIWQEEKVDLWVRPYKIVCFSNDSGLIEPILNTVSLHQIKKNSNKSLRDYFIDEYGDPDCECFQMAQHNFMESCAAYCLISYLLQVKDRHNGNILLHSDGHIIHIDFGFILSISPKNLGFEQSPFKLTPEFVDVMGGLESPLWLKFQKLLLKGLMAARKHMDQVINIVEIMRSSAQLPCFKNGCSRAVRNLRDRFHMNLTEQELERKLDQLVQDSLNSLSTKLYDGYQYLTNGIL